MPGRGYGTVLCEIQIETSYIVYDLDEGMRCLLSPRCSAHGEAMTCGRCLDRWEDSKVVHGNVSAWDAKEACDVSVCHHPTNVWNDDSYEWMDIRVYTRLLMSCGSIAWLADAC
jgi:hypothetical protein